MSESNFRLVEHQVEMTLHEDQQSKHYMYFEANAEPGNDDSRVAGYYMTLEKWETSHKPTTIYVNVTAVTPTSEPADEVEVFRSADSGQFVDEEFAERNPSTTIKHSYEER